MSLLLLDMDGVHVRRWAVQKGGNPNDFREAGHRHAVSVSI